eukprot:TRINITY_DN11513_c0_g1_i1.p1 TRINITY_DN11513_c0_g1~~TRINITY_DN11513_c0_g1_i1.p1  ORF type:complete len:203 (+),score=15.48 TRINITY_DN11513_c0_g1_i1:101-709(+)
MSTTTKTNNKSAAISFSIPGNTRYDVSALISCKFGRHTIICETPLLMGSIDGTHNGSFGQFEGTATSLTQEVCHCTNCLLMFIKHHDICGNPCPHAHSHTEDGSLPLHCFQGSTHIGPCVCSECSVSSDIIGFSEGYEFFDAVSHVYQDINTNKQMMTIAEIQSNNNSNAIKEVSRTADAILDALRNLTPEQRERLRRGPQN